MSGCEKVLEKYRFSGGTFSGGVSNFRKNGTIVENGVLRPMKVSPPKKRTISSSSSDCSPVRKSNPTKRIRLSSSSEDEAPVKPKPKRVILSESESDQESDSKDSNLFDQLTKQTRAKDQIKMLKNATRTAEKPEPEQAENDNSDDAQSISSDKSASNSSAPAVSERKARLKILKKKVVEFFNRATREDLQAMPRFKEKIVQIVFDNRPFESYDELSHLPWLDSLASNYLSELTLLQLLQDCNERSANLQTVADSKSEHFVKTPANMTKKLHLKPYQLIGLNWLILMRSQGLDAVLADEMGLGKTVQVIAFLAYLKEKQVAHTQTNLIIVPSSTIDNWSTELKRWCAQLKVITYFGGQDDRSKLRGEILNKRHGKVDVILTTYHMLRPRSEDLSFFRKRNLNYVIYDEAHMLKNCKTQRYWTLMRIKCAHKLLITGTPLQNNLVELISLLNFVMPDLFGKHVDDIRSLMDLFDNKGGSEQEAQSKIDQAKQILKPFILRRLKSDVLSQLPAKTETVYKCPMAEEQKELYDSVVAKYKGKHLNGKRGVNALMELRKAANHPLLLRNRYGDTVLRQMANRLKKSRDFRDSDAALIFEDMQVMSDFELSNLCQRHSIISAHKLPPSALMISAKLNRLEQILDQCKTDGVKVLLFSQFVIVLDILEAFLKHRKHSFLRLDGSVSVIERQDLIDRFNSEPDLFVFLLSTRAGGLGINLTAANVIVLHDIDFNPHNDRQAEDRCHRVGQTREVSVVKLICEETVEEAMLECAKNKLQLERKVTEDATYSSEDQSKTVHSLLQRALNA